MRGMSDPQVLVCTDEGERCQSWELHLPWPRALPASGLLAGLIKATAAAPEALESGACGGAGGAGVRYGRRMARPGVGSTHRATFAKGRASAR